MEFTYTLKFILVSHMLSYETGSFNGLFHFTHVTLFEGRTHLVRTAIGTQIAIEHRRTEQFIIGSWNWQC